MTKYVVYTPVDSDEPLKTNNWNEVVNFILEDNKAYKQFQIEYNNIREGRWDDTAFEHFIHDNLNDVAMDLGYSIVESK